MAPEAIADYVRERLENRVLGTKVTYGQLHVVVRPDAWPTAAQLCKEDPVLGFDFFDFMTAVDLREEGFAVVTHLYSVHHRHHIFLRAVPPGGRESPALPTLTHLYRGANWHERETYDMFGITFEGHPDLLPRILTVPNFEGWPLRKEFLLTSREAKPWPGVKEPKPVDDDEAAGDGQAAPAGPSGEDKAAAAKAKAERAKQKAAALRAKKAQEKAADQQAAAAGQKVDADRPGTTTATGEAAVTPDKPAEERAPHRVDDAEQADAARETRGGDTEGAAAAAAAVAEGEAAAQTPEGAAEVAGTDIAKDAAAGAPSGDTHKGAPQDAPGHDQPVEDAEEEARVAEGAKAAASGAPGVEAEGRHGGAEHQGGDRPAAETEGMTSPTQSDEAARASGETPAPEPGEAAAPSTDQGPSVGTEDLQAKVERDDLAASAPDQAAEPSAVETETHGGRARAADVPDPGSTGSGADAADRRGPDYRDEAGDATDDEGDGEGQQG